MAARGAIVAANLKAVHSGSEKELGQKNALTDSYASLATTQHSILNEVIMKEKVFTTAYVLKQMRMRRFNKNIIKQLIPFIIYIALYFLIVYLVKDVAQAFDVQEAIMKLLGNVVFYNN
jgi:hypothetical protein